MRRSQQAIAANCCQRSGQRPPEQLPKNPRGGVNLSLRRLQAAWLRMPWWTEKRKHTRELRPNQSDKEAAAGDKPRV